MPAAGGTKVYEERRKHSIEIMKNCDEKRVLIEDLVGGPLHTQGYPVNCILVTEYLALFIHNRLQNVRLSPSMPR